LRVPPTLLLLGILLATQAACTAGSSGSGPTGAACVTGDSPRRAAEALLERRTTAVRDGRSDMFVGTVDPDAGKVVAEQRAWFRRVQALPEHTFELSLSVNRSATEDALTAYVVEQTRLHGIDEKPAEVAHLTTFERHDGCWVLTADVPDRTEVAAAPWDAAGSFVVHRGGVVLVTDEATEAERDRILDAAAAAWRAERRVLRTQDRRPDDVGVVVLAFTTDAAMEAAGFYHQDLDLTGGVELPVQMGPDQVDYRVLVAPTMLGLSAAEELPELMRHEFVHVLLARHPLAPSWVVEGAAEYYASGEAGGPRSPLSEMVPSGSRTDGAGLPADADFYSGDWASRAGSYAVGWAAMTCLGREHGTDEPARLLKALDRAQAAYYPKRVDRVLERRYGVSPDELGACARALIDERRSR
jgi:hypothetical protein